MVEEEEEDKVEEKPVIEKPEPEKPEQEIPILEAGKEKSIIEQAKEERKLSEDTTAKMKLEREKLEKATADSLLAGKGQINTNPEQTEHEKYIEGAKERYKGTGRDPTLGFKRSFD